MKKRMIFPVALALVCLGSSLVSEAQEPNRGRVWRIGWLSQASSAGGTSELEALRKRLGELGYVEGREIAIEARWADGEPARLEGLARALVQLKVDVLCTTGTLPSLAGKQATRTIPIVFSGVAFPERTGLVASLARPGSNLTGVAIVGSEYGKRLQLLRDVSPSISRVALLYNDKNIASVLAVNETQEAAKTLSVSIEPVGAHDDPSLETALATIRRTRPDALLTTADPFLASHRTRIVTFARERDFISMYGDRSYVMAGGLMFYGTSRTDQWRHAAIFVDRILKGAKPGDLPVEQPVRFEFLINMKTAKSLRLTIPTAVLLRADQVIDE